MRRELAWKPITICQERKAQKSKDVFDAQISPLFDLPIDWRRVVLVYEPVWSFKDEALVVQEVEFPPNDEVRQLHLLNSYAKFVTILANGKV